jgi:hypothetical protein
MFNFKGNHELTCLVAMLYEKCIENTCIDLYIEIFKMSSMQSSFKSPRFVSKFIFEKKHLKS